MCRTPVCHDSSNNWCHIPPGLAGLRVPKSFDIAISCPSVPTCPIWALYLIPMAKKKHLWSVLATELEQKWAVGLFHSGARVPSVCSTLLRKDELAERRIQTARKIRGHSLALALLFFWSRWEVAQFNSDKSSFWCKQDGTNILVMVLRSN